MSATRDRLIQIKKEHGLTYAGIAELAGAPIGTVEGWLATPGLVSARAIPQYRLDLIEIRLRLRALAR